MSDINYNDERVIECKEMFDIFDKDRSGTISLKELGDVLRALGGTPSVQELQDMIDNVGSENGQIKFEAFLDIFEKKMKESDSDEDLISAFKVFDKDSDGFISCEELKLKMTTLGEKVSPEKADEMLKEEDVKGTGQINYYKLVEYLTKSNDI